MTPPYPKPTRKRKSIGQTSAQQVNANRAGVYERDNYQCVASSLGGCMGDLTMQHRVSKGSGGSALFDTSAHLITLCWHHNVREMQDADLRRKFIANGWSVARAVLLEHSIEEIPALYPDGTWRRNFTNHFGQAIEPDGAWLMVRMGIRKEPAF